MDRRKKAQKAQNCGRGCPFFWIPHHRGQFASREALTPLVTRKRAPHGVLGEHALPLQVADVV